MCVRWLASCDWRNGCGVAQTGYIYLQDRFRLGGSQIGSRQGHSILSQRDNEEGAV